MADTKKKSSKNPNEIQPELYEAVYKEVANKLGISEQGIPSPTQVTVPVGATVIQGYGYNGAVKSYQPVEQQINTSSIGVDIPTPKVEEETQKEIKSKILEEVKPSVKEIKLESQPLEQPIKQEKPKSKKKNSDKADLFNFFQSNGG